MDEISTLPGLVYVKDGEWAGWSYYPGHEPFEAHVGTFFARRDEGGRVVCGFRPDGRHLNGGGMMHGGALMTFADFSLFMISQAHLHDGYDVTVSFNAEFVSGGGVGEIVLARGEVIREGRSLVFVRGHLEMQDRILMTYSAVVKKIPRSH